MAAESQQNGETDGDLPGTVVEDLLASGRRRTALSCLRDHGGEMVVADLAACICARERGTAAEEVRETEREALYDELYDEHLPKLTATEVVTFDSLRDSVTLNEGTPLGTDKR